MSKPVIFITGTSQGLGKELAASLAGDGQVFTVNRRVLPGPQYIKCNFTERYAVFQTAQRLIELSPTSEPVTFILNAAVYGTDVVISDVDPVSLGELMYVNVFAQLTLVELMLKANLSVRLVAISGQMGSVSSGDETYHFGYAASKAALNLSVRLLHARESKLDYLIVDPGWMQTKMGGPGATEPPREVAANLKAIMAEPSFWNNETGMVRVETREIIPW